MCISTVVVSELQETHLQQIPGPFILDLYFLFLLTKFEHVF